MAKRNVPPVEKYHDRVAGIYDTIYDGNPYWEATFELTWRHMQKVLPRATSTRCLDVGCGTGRWGMRLFKSGFQTDFLDISWKMLEQVRKKIEKLDNLSYEPQLYHTSIEAMPMIEDESYDFIIGQGDPLGSAGIPERTLKELCRILRPGGVMMMSVDNAYGGMFHYLKDGDVDGLEEFLRSGKTNWVTDDKREQYEVIAFTPEKIRKLCAARGLEVISLVGKTALPLRRFQEVLRDKEKRERLLQLEERLSCLESMLGNAAHLEFVARKPLNEASAQPTDNGTNGTAKALPQIVSIPTNTLIERKTQKEERKRQKQLEKENSRAQRGPSKYALKKLEQTGDAPQESEQV